MLYLGIDMDPRTIYSKIVEPDAAVQVVPYPVTHPKDIVPVHPSAVYFAIDGDNRAHCFSHKPFWQPDIFGCGAWIVSGVCGRTICRYCGEYDLDGTDPSETLVRLEINTTDAKGHAEKYGFVDASYHEPLPYHQLPTFVHVSIKP